MKTVSYAGVGSHLCDFGNGPTLHEVIIRRLGTRVGSTQHVRNVHLGARGMLDIEVIEVIISF